MHVCMCACAHVCSHLVMVMGVRVKVSPPFDENYAHLMKIMLI